MRLSISGRKDGHVLHFKWLLLENNACKTFYSYHTCVVYAVMCFTVLRDWEIYIVRMVVYKSIRVFSGFYNIEE